MIHLLDSLETPLYNFDEVLASVEMHEQNMLDLQNPNFPNDN